MSACACPSYPQGTRGRQLSEAAVRIQAAYRGMHARTQLRTARAAATRIQVGGWAGGGGPCCKAGTAQGAVRPQTLCFV